MANDNLNPELQDKLKACETEEELREVAAAVGQPLADDQVEGVAGGGGFINTEAEAGVRCRLLDGPCDRLGPCIDYIKSDPWIPECRTFRD